MTTLGKISVSWQEDGSATVLARITARDGTGAYTGVRGEGNWVKQADLSAVTYKVFDTSDTWPTPTTATSSGTVTISTSIIDTPVTDGHIWDVDDDTVGYNFLLDLPGSCFPTGDHRYLVEVYFTSTGGSTWAVQWEGVAAALNGS